MDSRINGQCFGLQDAGTGAFSATAIWGATKPGRIDKRLKRKGEEADAIFGMSILLLSLSISLTCFLTFGDLHIHIDTRADTYKY